MRARLDAGLQDKLKKPQEPVELEAQFHVMVTCRDEKHQVELLERFAAEGLMCKALLA